MAVVILESSNVFIPGYRAEPPQKKELTDQQIDLLFRLPDTERWLLSVELAVMGYAVPMLRATKSFSAAESGYPIPN